jgi:hypothetical protein
MHWFDRVAKGVAAAPEKPTTRRSVLNVALKGTAVAAVAGPLSLDTVVYANNRMQGLMASSACLDCLKAARSEYMARSFDCAYKSGESPIHEAGRFTSLLKPKKGGSPGKSGGSGKPKKRRKQRVLPWEGPAESACDAFFRGQFIKQVNACRKGACAPQAPPPVVAPESPSGTVCASGTTKCGATICCYGNDACCGCAATGGLICCAAVIGCTCC